VSAAFTHLTADLSGLRAEQLRDRALVTGLVIAAVGGAGLTSLAAPTIHERPQGGLSAVLLLEPGHLVVHALPERGRLLVDLLTLATQEPLKALEVFQRRLAPRDVRTELRALG
jgi:S-adenosylmethionine decarboxylase